jgi:acetyl esterase/lipase/lysophospholipase L1-like esterase
MKFRRHVVLSIALLFASTFVAPVAAQDPSFNRTEDVIYGRKSGVALTLDVFTPEKPKGVGVILVVSGGWFSAHEVIRPELCGEVLKRGYTVFTVVHGSQPKFTIPEILLDMHRAVRFIRHHAAEYGIDPHHLGIMGGSAGGHLSLMQGMAGTEGDSKSPDPVEHHSSRVQSVACFFPPSDFLNYGEPGEVALGRGKLAGFRAPFDFHQWSDAEKRFVEITDEAKILEIGKQISPITHVTADDAPTLIIHGDADTLVPIQQGQIIIDKLKETGVKAELIVKEGAGHGWADLAADTAKFADWFDETLPALKAKEAKEEEKPKDAAADSRFEVPESDEGLLGAGPIRRHEWFRPIWRERRKQFAERAKQDHGAIVFLGDSITQGWADDFRGEFKELKKLANRGISGDTTRGMLFRLEEDVLALDPKGVVMLMGTNDLGENAEPATIAGNVKLIVDKLQEHDGAMPVVLSLVMPSAASEDRPADKIKELNRLLQEVMTDEPQVTVLDTWTLFANKDGDAKPEEFPDLLHPNEVGYAKWAAALRPVLATHGFLETDRESFTPEEGFELLFNGKDLTGWGFRPTTKEDLATIEQFKSQGEKLAWPIVEKAVSFDGRTESSDGRYVAKNGRLVVTTPVEGRRVQQLWTTRDFPDDFVLKLEFRATPNADSGVFIRGPQLQCRDYLLAGPYTELKNYQPQDWNELEVTVADGVARATCNGEVLEESLKLPETGPLGLEGDRGQMEYRRIRVRETK